MSLVKDVRKEITAGSNITGSVTIPIGTKVKIISILDDGFHDQARSWVVRRFVESRRMT